MSQGICLRKYGVEFIVDFDLYEVDGVDLRTDWVPAAADCEVMKDGGASTQCTNTATDEGSTYSIVITATEAEAARLVIKVVDAATKVFLDKVIIVETYGNASAQHAFDLDTATQKVDVETIKTQAVTAAAGVTINPSVGAATIVPTNTQFESRSLPSADYVVVGDTIAGVTLATTTTKVTNAVVTDASSRTASKATGFATPTDVTVAHAITDETIPTVTEIWAQTLSDLAAGAPDVTTESVLDGIARLWEYNFHKVITNTTNGEVEVYKANGTTKLMEQPINDDGTLFTRSAAGAAD